MVGNKVVTGWVFLGAAGYFLQECLLNHFCLAFWRALSFLEALVKPKPLVYWWWVGSWDSLIAEGFIFTLFYFWMKLMPAEARGSHQREEKHAQALLETDCTITA